MLVVWFLIALQTPGLLPERIIFACVVGDERQAQDE
jgi:hypothetical protein